MSPEQTLKLRRIHAELSAILTGETTTPAPDAKPTRGSALRAVVALSDSLPDTDLGVEVDQGAHLIIRVGEGARDTADRARVLTDVAAHLDTVTAVELHPYADTVQVWTRGQLAGCGRVRITLIVPGDTPDLDELLAPLRALVPAEPADDPDAAMLGLAELSAASQEHRTGGAL